MYRLCISALYRLCISALYRLCIDSISALYIGSVSALYRLIDRGQFAKVQHPTCRQLPTAPEATRLLLQHYIMHTCVKRALTSVASAPDRVDSLWQLCRSTLYWIYIGSILTLCGFYAGSISAQNSSRRRVMVLVDSLHTRDHVLAELQAYSALVSPSSYVLF